MCPSEPDPDPDKPVAVRVMAASCPVCGKSPSVRHRPFCSKRCAHVDLGRWLGGAYAVPGHEPVDPEEMAAALGVDGGKDVEGI